MANKNFTRKRANLGGLKALDRAANENGFGLDVFVVNGNVPVRFETTKLYVDSLFNQIRKEYFVNGIKGSYVLQTVADVSSSLQNKIIQISTPNKRYDLYFVNDSSTPTDSEANGLTIIQKIINFTTNDTAITIAGLIVAALEEEGNHVVIQGETDASMLLITNLRVGSYTSPALMTSGFSIAEEVAGTSPVWTATRFQDFEEVDGKQVVMSEEWVTEFDKDV